MQFAQVLQKDLNFQCTLLFRQRNAMEEEQLHKLLEHVHPILPSIYIIYSNHKYGMLITKDTSKIITDPM